MNELEQLIATMCPSCAAAARAVLDAAQAVLTQVKAAAAKEAEARHVLNEAAAKQRIESNLGEAERVLKGDR